MTIWLDPSGVTPEILTELREIRAREREADLARAITYAVETVPYYRARRDIYEIGDLRSLPIMKRPAVRDNLTELVSDEIDIKARVKDGSILLAGTSGTSGERLMVPSDMTLHRVPPGFEQAWGLDEIEHLPRTAVLTGPACINRVCGSRGYADSPGVSYCPTQPNPFDLLPAQVEEICGIIEGADFFMVNPIYAHVLTLLAGKLSIELPSVKAVLLGYQFAGQRQREIVSTAFRAPVFDMYAAVDLAGCQIGVQCRYGNMHVREDHVIIEIEAKAGEIGEVLVTTVAAQVMPLFRYRVGDVARWTDHVDCACGLADWRTFELHGRERDRLWLNGDWLTTRQFDQIMNDLDLYQADQTGADDIVLRVVGEVPARVRRIWRDKLEPTDRFPTARSMKYPPTVRTWGGT